MNKKRSEIAKISSEKYSSDNMVRQYYSLFDQVYPNKKVLEINVNYMNSSTGQIVYDISRNASRYNKKVVVCYGRGSKVKADNVYKFGYDWETYLHAILSRLTGYNGCFSFFSTWKLINIIRKNKPDIIHVHELHAYYVNFRQLLSFIKKRDIPLIATLHCEYMYTGKCGHAYDCVKFKSCCGNCPAVQGYPKSLFLDKTRQMFEMKKDLFSNWNFMIVTPSEWLRSRVKQSILGDKNVVVINNGVDASIFHPVETDDLRERLKIAQDTKISLFVAPKVTDEHKGINWLIEIARKMKDENILFLLIGEGSEDKRFLPNMRYIGPIRDKNLLAKFYSLADVFLMLSEKETYSMTCAEALCCGTPIVGFMCGAPETIFAGEYARFVEYGDVAMVVDKIKEFTSTNKNSVKNYQ